MASSAWRTPSARPSHITSNNRAEVDAAIKADEIKRFRLALTTATPLVKPEIEPTRIRALLSTSLLLFVMSLAGCAVAPTHLTKEEDAIRVFASAPPCKYKILGAVGGSTGSTFWGTDGNYNATVSRMKKDAYKLGANAIIIKSENTSVPGVYGGSANDMLADAILCEDAG